VNNPSANNGHGAGYTITNSAIRVEYFLNPDFAQYVESYTCNGQTVINNVREFTGGSAFPGSEFILNTVFTFKDDI
jgi:hypothetical protein